MLSFKIAFLFFCLSFVIDVQCLSRRDRDIPPEVAQLWLSGFRTAPSQFSECKRLGNARGMTRVLMFHPGIRFIDADIDDFNQILDALPSIEETFEPILQHIVNRVMRRHHIALNIESYKTLKRLYERYPRFRVFAKYIHSADPDQVTVRRLKNMEEIKKMYGVSTMELMNTVHILYSDHLQWVNIKEKVLETVMNATHARASKRRVTFNLK